MVFSPIQTGLFIVVFYDRGEGGGGVHASVRNFENFKTGVMTVSLGR